MSVCNSSDEDEDSSLSSQSLRQKPSRITPAIGRHSFLSLLASRVESWRLFISVARGGGVDNKYMSRVGLSIDSSSESCSSDLSDSEGSFSIWTKQPPEKRSLSYDCTDNNNLILPTRRCESRSSLPLLLMNVASSSSRSSANSPNKSYRSRIHCRRLEEMQHHPAAATAVDHSEDDDEEEDRSENVATTTRCSHRRHPRVNLRFGLMLCALTLVSLSLRDVSQSRPTHNVSTIPREEVAFPLHLQQQEQKRLNKEFLPKYYLDQNNMDPNTNVVVPAGNLRNLKHRSNVALARSSVQNSRPVFGPESSPKEEEEEDRKIKRFVLHDPKPYHPPKHHTFSWTSWIAGFALVCMFFETGYTEIRRCRMDTGALEEERRL